MELFLQKLLYSAFYVALLGLIVGFSFALIPGKVFLKHEKLFPFFKFEDGGKLYSRYFKINAWKDKLPQFSEITHFGFSKTSLNILSEKYLYRFKIETLRAESSHWFLILISPIYFLVTDKILLPLVIIGNLIGNLPFIMIQRYNRARIGKVISKIEKSEK